MFGWDKDTLFSRGYTFFGLCFPLLIPPLANTARVLSFRLKREGNQVLTATQKPRRRGGAKVGDPKVTSPKSELRPSSDRLSKTMLKKKNLVGSAEHSLPDHTVMFEVAISLQLAILVPILHKEITGKSASGKVNCWSLLVNLNRQN